MSGNLLMKTRVVAVRDVAKDVRSIEIVHHSRPLLPAFTAGAHILVETPAGPCANILCVRTPGMPAPIGSAS